MVDVAIDNRSGQELPLARIEELAAFVLEREGPVGSLELSISFVDVDEMIRLNTIYRDRAEPTDILSFELDDPWAECSDAKDSHTLLGDIVIQPDIARDRARAEELSFEEELWVLVIHGILHLLGHDHMTRTDAAKMEAIEDACFAQWEMICNEH
jgi:probable rRNA maturation factor